MPIRIHDTQTHRHTCTETQHTIFNSTPHRSTVVKEEQVTADEHGGVREKDCSIGVVNEDIAALEGNGSFISHNCTLAMLSMVVSKVTEADNKQRPHFKKKKKRTVADSLIRYQVQVHNQHRPQGACAPPYPPPPK